VVLLADFLEQVEMGCTLDQIILYSVGNKARKIHLVEHRREDLGEAMVSCLLWALHQALDSILFLHLEWVVMCPISNPGGIGVMSFLLQWVFVSCLWINERLTGLQYRALTMNWVATHKEVLTLLIQVAVPSEVLDQG